MFASSRRASLTRNQSAIAVPVGTTQMPQILLTTSSDALLLVGRDTTRWTREESLSDIAAVRFLALGEREVEETSHILADETFAERLLRHTKQLKVSRKLGLA